VASATWGNLMNQLNSPTPEQIEAYRDFLLDPCRKRGTITYSGDVRPTRGAKPKAYWCPSKKKWRAKVDGRDCLFETEAEATAAIRGAVTAQRGLKFIPPEPVKPERADPEDDDRFIDERTGEYGEDERGEEDCNQEEHQDCESDQLDRIYFDPL
jgi:hypothetical protein